MFTEKRKSLFIFFLIISILLVGCSTDTGDAPASDSSDGESGKVMLYSSLKDTQLAALKEGFMKKYPNIKMDYYTAGTGNVMTKIATEQQAGGINADLIWVGDPTNYIQFKEEGILMPYESPEAKNIPDRFKDEDNEYIAARIITLGFVYNTDLVKEDEAPKSWSDLLKPEFKDNLAMSDPTSAGTTLYTVAGLIQNPDYGWDYFKKLKNNGLKLESGSSGVVNKVGAGEYKVCIGVDYIARALIDKGSPIAFSSPGEDIPIIESPIAIVKDTKNLEAAKLLYDYIISEEGQKILAETFATPVLPGISQGDSESTDELLPKMLPVDSDRLAEDKLDVLDNFDGIFK